MYGMTWVMPGHTPTHTHISTLWGWGGKEGCSVYNMKAEIITGQVYTEKSNCHGIMPFSTFIFKQIFEVLG